MTMNGCGSKDRIERKKDRLKEELAKENPDHSIIRDIKKSIKRNINIAKYKKHRGRRVKSKIYFKPIKIIPKEFTNDVPEGNKQKEKTKKSKFTKRGNLKKKTKTPKNPHGISLSQYKQMKKQGKDV